MITWIQNIIQKHHKILFSVLLAVIIVSFVFYVGGTPKSYNASSEVRDFYGCNLNSMVERLPFEDGSRISGQLNKRYFYNAQHQQFATYERIIYLYLADQLAVPGPNKKELLEFIESLPFFADADGKFDRENYDRFFSSISSNPELNRDVIFTYLSEDFRIEIVKKAMAGPGFVLPLEAKESLREEGITWSIGVATFNYAGFSPPITTTDEQITEFYKENEFRYKIGPRLQVSYVHFNNSAFKDKVSLPENEEDLKAYYESNRGKFAGKDGFEDAKSDVEKAYLEEKMQEAGMRFANDELVYRIYKEDILQDSEQFEDLLKEIKVSITNVTPYSKKMLTASGRPVFERFLDINTLRKAYNMTRYYSDPYPVRDGVAVLFLKKETLPEMLLPLDKIRDRVIGDLKEKMKKDAFSSKGELIHASLIEKKKDVSFDFKAAAEKEGLAVAQFAEFTIATPPEGLDRSVLANIKDLEISDITPMVTKDNNGTFIYLKNKVIPEIADDDEKLQESLDKSMTRVAGYAGQGIVSEMMEHALEKFKGN